MKHLLRRIRDWCVGPGGWLTDSDMDDRLSAVDLELDEMQRLERAGLNLTYDEKSGWHFETGKPWPKHTRPHPLGEDYPK